MEQKHGQQLKVNCRNCSYLNGNLKNEAALACVGLLRQ